ncbi:2-dehydropantoate 2-reductase [Massarina eburnea CBS 473.64]|uniref:2-dehydropantoate 2-reductase n=1 Tax=Massarina eburnea CBS 473.64 TaxID=1395130 RepID=A0A6A6S119_9PLEO|nr:2-dehydropantoate 2-reductase [Massarina eburnea CBS 473.64]
MTTDDTPKVLLFGVGSVGAVYLYLLSKVCSTTVVCRSNYDVVKKRGFVINSTIFGDNLLVKPNVVRNCGEVSTTDSSADNQPFDYVLVCSKAIPGIIPSEISAVVTPGHTIIVLLQNGINIEEEYVEAFPGTPIVSAAVYCKTTQRPAGVVTHDEIEKLQIGIYPPTASPGPAENFVTLLTACGGTAEFWPDVQQPRWYKLIMNASWNPICALTRATDVDFMASGKEATELIFDVMLEVCEIAKAHGYTITREQAEAQLQRAKARVGQGKSREVEPSMLQDVREGRRLEVEAIVGNTVRAGKAKGVPCPKLEVVYMLVRALDGSIGRAN